MSPRRKPFLNSHPLSREEARRGGLRRAELEREGREALRAVEEGRLIPAKDAEGDEDPCPMLESRKAIARERAGLAPKKREYIVVEPKSEIPSGLLELQRMDPAQRARLLAD